MRKNRIAAFAHCCCALSLFLGLLAAQDPAPAGGGAAAPAAAPTGPRIAWESDFDAALARADKEHKPIFVAFLMDNEPGNDMTIEKNYVDPEVVKLANKCVCLACCIGDHKGDDGLCKKFKGITCAQHQGIEKKARARWLVGNEVTAPQHVFCDPKGQAILRRIYYIDIDTMKKVFAMALADMHDPDAEAVMAAEKQKVDSWLKDTESNNQEVRDAALRLLAQCDDPRALPRLLELAKPGGSDITRQAAIGALAQKGNYLAVKPLAAMLGEKKAPIAMRLAQTLETIRMPDATPDILAALKKEKRDRVRGFLLRAAARCSPENATARQLALQALKGASAQLEPCVMIALGFLQPHDSIVAAVKPKLDDKAVNTRGLAVWVLGAQRTAECKALIAGVLKDEKTPEVVLVAQSAMKRCNGEKVESYESLYGGFFSSWDY